MRPKWLLTMPSGRLMIEESISGLSLENIDSILVIALKHHLDSHISSKQISDLLSQQTSKPVEVLALTEKTSSQAHTVAFALKKCFVSDEPFFVKDVDNFFALTPAPEDSIAYIDLNNVATIHAKSKSYIAFDALKNIYQIIEKNVISSFFCCGGYSFASSDVFLSSWASLEDVDGEVYISHVIYDLIHKNHNFLAREAEQYIDWGTLLEYNRFKDLTVTIFADFDGVLVKNSSKFASTPWAYEPITSNLISLKKILLRSPCSQLIITTSRPHSQINAILGFLSEYGLRPVRIIADLPHSKRILINDFSPTNHYPSALSISLPRDSSSLECYLDSF